MNKVQGNSYVNIKIKVKGQQVMTRIFTSGKKHITEVRNTSVIIEKFI